MHLVGVLTTSPLEEHVDLVHRAHVVSLLHHDEFEVFFHSLCFAFDLLELGSGLPLLIVDELADLVDLGLHAAIPFDLVGVRAVGSLGGLLADHTAQDLCFIDFVIILLEQFLMMLMQLEKEFAWHLHLLMELTILTLICLDLEP